MLFTDYLKQRKTEETEDLKEKAESTATIEKKLQEVAKAMQASAESGNIDRFMELDAESQKLRNMLTVAKAKNVRSMTEEEVKKAWESYVKTYRKEYDAQLKKYAVAKKALYAEFRNLAEVINKGLKESRNYPLESAKWDIALFEPNESKLLFLLFNDNMTFKEKENIRLVFNGVAVEDIANTESINDALERWTEKKRETERKFIEERTRQRDIINKVRTGKLPKSAINWVDTDQERETCLYSLR